MIDWICYNCGVKYCNFIPEHLPTWHVGVCDICKDKKAVTQARDFGHLKIKVPKKIKELKNE